eukprot:3563537-Alexandrium_andersonii.AAC.1
MSRGPLLVRRGSRSGVQWGAGTCARCRRSQLELGHIGPECAARDASKKPEPGTRDVLHAMSHCVFAVAA